MATVNYTAPLTDRKRGDIIIDAETGKVALCDSCDNPSSPMDFCPYQQEINDDDCLCLCCPDCRQDCADDI
jgi:hypothetical protein